MPIRYFTVYGGLRDEGNIRFFSAKINIIFFATLICYE